MAIFKWIPALLTLLSSPPSAIALPNQIPIQPEDHSQGYKFDPLIHLPGISRYFDAVGFGLEHTAPLGCKVTTASYLIRHSAIYANDDEYDEYIKPFIFKLENHRGKFSGPLDFLNTWHSPIDEDTLEEVTPHGLHDAEGIGRHITKRYPHLVGTAKRILSDKKARCLDTAKAFVKGFPGSESIEVVEFSKPKDGTMNPIIPHKSCKNFTKEPGKKDMHKFLHVYATRTSARLDPFTPFHLEDKDILAMQSICGYESAISGIRSPFCPIFTDAEWMAYEYAWDLRYAHMVGPLNPFSHHLGFPWLKAQHKLFKAIDDPDNKDAAFDINGDIVPQRNLHASKKKAKHQPTDGYAPSQRFFLSFTHREVPPLIATALGIFNSSFEEKGQFPTDHVVWTRAWKMSDLIPFLGHVGLEKMTCDRPGMEGEYIRVIANTAPRPMSACQNGPGASCPMEEFNNIIKAGKKKYGDWKSVCGMK